MAAETEGSKEAVALDVASAGEGSEDGDAAAHPLTARANSTPASVEIRWVIPPRSITRPAYPVALRPDYGEVIARMTQRCYAGCASWSGGCQFFSPASICRASRFSGGGRGHVAYGEKTQGGL